MAARPQGSLSLFPNPNSIPTSNQSRSPSPPLSRPHQPKEPSPREPRSQQPVLRIRTTDDIAVNRPAPRPVEITPPQRRQVDTAAFHLSPSSLSSSPPPPPPPHLPSPPLQQPLRSIFPTYDPSLPLQEQQYYAPTHAASFAGQQQIPRAAISRRSYHCARGSTASAPELLGHGGPAISGSDAGSSFGAPTAVARGTSETNRPYSTTSQLRGLWKAANGWRACGSEGRVYCLALSRLRDAPVYTLASASGQPFYSLRLDPTSGSAYLSVSRHDPARPYKPENSPSSPAGTSGGSGGGSRASDTKGWHEALATTLEEQDRHHAPNDGLVALLMPSPAAAMATQRAADPGAVAAAERECGRLVWDDDAAAHFLVHPALAAPFRVTVDRVPAYSRTEYTLEHHESPRNLARLSRDAAGGGCLVIDTAVAAWVEAYYLIDVAVAALILVAAADDRKTMTSPQAPFEAPPQPQQPAPPPPAVLAREKDGKRSSRHFKLPSVRRKIWKKKRAPADEFDMDVESQDGGMSKAYAMAEEPVRKRPFVLRVLIKVAKGLFKCILWIATVLFKCLGGVFKLCYRCVGSKY